MEIDHVKAVNRKWWTVNAAKYMLHAGGRYYQPSPCLGVIRPQN